MTNNNTHDYVSLLDPKRKQTKKSYKSHREGPPPFNMVSTLPDSSSSVNMRKGYILNYFEADGYGFVRSDDGTDYFFRIEKFKGLAAEERPVQGRYVLFQAEAPEFRQMGKAPRILTISYDKGRISEKVEAQTPDKMIDSGRVKCPHCGKMMIPRVKMYAGKILGSFCPFCFGDFKVVETEDSSPFCLGDFLFFLKAIAIVGLIAISILLFFYKI